jgi:hypothetical protein
MALTLCNLAKMVKSNLHNDADLVDPDDYYLYLTLGQEMMVQDSPSTLGVKDGTLALTLALGRKYSLATDFYQNRGMFLTTTNCSLNCIPVKQFMETVERLSTVPSGPPRGYCITGVDSATGLWQVAFDYIPDDSYTVKYWYYWMPPTLEDPAEIPPVSAIGFDTCLVWAATKMGLQGKDPSGYAMASQMYEKEMKQFKDFNPQGPDYTPVLQPSGSYVRSGSTLRLPPQFPAY